MTKKSKPESNIVVYQSKSGALELRTDAERDTIWLTQDQLASLFDVQNAAISKHIKNIFDNGELERKATVSKMETVQKEGFIVKNHPFTDGNKRSGAYAFVWFLQQTKVLDLSRITPPALTAITLLIAESDAKDKEKMIGLVCTMLSKKI